MLLSCLFHVQPIQAFGRAYNKLPFCEWGILGKGRQWEIEKTARGRQCIYSKSELSRYHGYHILTVCTQPHQHSDVLGNSVGISG